MTYPIEALQALPPLSDAGAEDTSLTGTGRAFLELLSLADREALLEKASRRVLGRRQVLFSGGEPRSSVFILRSGRIKLLRRTQSGSEVIITLCGPGELVGYSGLANGTARLASAHVVEAGDAYVLDETDFRGLLARRPGIAMAVIESMRRRMESVADSLTDVVTEDVPNRIVRLLRRLARTQGEQRNGEAVLDLRLTHQELANMVGARRQTVTTAINDLHRDGVLRREQHRVVITGARPARAGSARLRSFWVAAIAAGTSLGLVESSLLG